MRWRNILAAVILSLAPGPVVVRSQAAEQQSPEDWAASCVDVKELDFGTTVRGLEPVKTIRITNRWKEPLHVAGITSSMGPFFIKKGPEDAIRSRETADVVVYLNTIQHQGAKKQAITITFDSPFYAQVRVQTKAYIRMDLVCDTGPGGGTLTLGKSGKESARVSHLGKKDWKILAVECSHPDLDVLFREMSRKASSEDPKSEVVEYEVTAALKPGAAEERIETAVTVRLPDKECSSFSIPVVREAIAKTKASAKK